MYQRHYLKTLRKRMLEPRRFIQVISGPRQIGKTTLVKQILKQLQLPSIYLSADGQIDNSGFWINNAWEQARLQLKTDRISEIILCLDEIQKINNWSEYIKKEWDLDTLNNTQVKVILLGSSRLLIQEGLSESLAGRFESISMNHWSCAEMNDAFGMTPDQYVFFGGYPGAFELLPNETRWKEYVRDSLVETAISRDIFQMTKINKPALLKRLFDLSANYSGQIISYTKILGQLQDAGNTVTIAHYLDLLSTAGLIGGIEKYSGQKLRQRSSSPKLQVYNTAITGSLSSMSFKEAREKSDYWGRLVESAVGSHLINSAFNKEINLYYWRDRNMEVDFVMESHNQLVALEVKSGRKKNANGLREFAKRFAGSKPLVIGTGGIPWETFLKTDPLQLF